MVGRTPLRGRDWTLPRRSGRLSVLLIALCAAVLAGCSDAVVTNDDALPARQTSTSAGPPLPAPPNNDNLANAFNFAAQQNDQTAYYFTSPSKRWVCAIVPRATAGCQATSGSTIPITGAPSSVPQPDGTDAVPNAIEVGVEDDPHFASLEAPGVSLVPGPAPELPFNKVLVVAGFRCNVQEATGISCASEVSGKGFTFSAEGFTLQYTDLTA